MNTDAIITATQNWLSQFIIKYSICPFAKQVFDQAQIRYQLFTSNDIPHNLANVIRECQYLDQHPEIETSLLIFNNLLQDFDDYLDFVAIAEELLFQQGYEGIYQLASFHPDYCFADSDPDDAANYTNRSPYPMLHLIREASISKALEHYPNPDSIPERNIALTRELGLVYLQGLLASVNVQ